jgi:hypothetical protein
MSDPMGLAAARGASGGWDSLNKILARQELARQQALLEERQRASDAGVIQDRELRRMQYDDVRTDRKADNERADRAEKAQTELRTEQATKTREAEEREAKRVANLEAIVNDPNADPALRRQAGAALMNRGGTVPTELFRDRDREAERAKEAITLKFDLGDRNAARDDGRGDASGQAKAERDDPKKPNGVMSYLLQLKGKYKTADEAINELDTAWADIKQAHPNANAAAITQELIGMYDRPKGTAARAPITINASGLANR